MVIDLNQTFPMKKDVFETIVGFFVLLVAAVFLVFAMKISGTRTVVGGYEVVGRFQNVDGISPGSEVKLGGVNIGNVISTAVDTNSYDIVVAMKIDRSIRIPTDSSFRISTGGLIGAKFIRVDIGADDAYLANGDQIEFTQSTMDLEELISKFFFKTDN